MTLVNSATARMLMDPLSVDNRFGQRASFSGPDLFWSLIISIRILPVTTITVTLLLLLPLLLQILVLVLVLWLLLLLLQCLFSTSTITITIMCITWFIWITTTIIVIVLVIVIVQGTTNSPKFERRQSSHGNVQTTVCSGGGRGRRPTNGVWCGAPELAPDVCQTRFFAKNVFFLQKNEDSFICFVVLVLRRHISWKPCVFNKISKKTQIPKKTAHRKPRLAGFCWHV